MFHSISWQTFFITIAILLVLYYAFVFGTLFRQDIKQFLLKGAASSKTQNDLPGQSIFEVVENVTEDSRTSSEHESDLFPIAYALADEVKIVIKDAGYRRLIREETMQAIRALIIRPPYQRLRATFFRQAINNLVEVETERHCSMHLAEDELNALWIL